MTYGHVNPVHVSNTILFALHFRPCLRPLAANVYVHYVYNSAVREKFLFVYIARAPNTWNNMLCELKRIYHHDLTIQRINKMIFSLICAAGFDLFIYLYPSSTRAAKHVRMCYNKFT